MMALNVRRKSELLEKVALFNRKVEEHHEKQLSNPFSDVDRPADYTVKKLDIHDPNYGRPVAGSKTAIRGQEASEHMRKELKVLCEVINDCGFRMRDGRAAIAFGSLFTYYNAISDKCVGNLMSARKHKLVTFEGEMLYQRRDDDTIIMLTQPYEELCKMPILSGAPPAAAPAAAVQIVLTPPTESDPPAAVQVVETSKADPLPTVTIQAPEEPVIAVPALPEASNDAKASPEPPVEQLSGHPQPVEPVETVPVVPVANEPEAVEVTHVESVVIEPVPVEPLPAEAVPVEPLPVEPISVEPLPVELVSVEPLPVEPVSVEQLPVDSVTVEPLPVEPVPSESVPAEPIPTEPVLTEPLPTEPVTTEPLPTEPVTTEPKPVYSQPELEPSLTEASQLNDQPIDNVENTLASPRPLTPTPEQVAESASTAMPSALPKFTNVETQPVA